MDSYKALPITNIGDPYVLNENGTYYLYATSMFNGFYCWKSANLTDWSAPSVCYRADERSFGNSCFWASEVYEFGGRFYMYYTAQWKKYEEEQLRIGVAIADRPEGPFRDGSDAQPMFDFGYGVLDAHVLKDGDANYLYYSRAGANHIVNGAKTAEIYVVPLGDDLVSVKGEGKRILTPEQPWELAQPEHHQFWNEGPFVVKHDGKYHIMYSANFFQSKFYGIGGAVSDMPTGPFRKYPDNPILAASETMSGPGHNSVAADQDGNLYCFYHAHTDCHAGGENRRVYVTPLWFENGEIHL